MPIRWGGFDLRQFEDPAIRSQMKKADVWMKQRDASTLSTATTANTTNASATGYVKTDGSRALTGTWTWNNNVNLALGSAGGTRIGTATTQKLAFWNSAPTSQFTATGETTGFTAGVGAAVLLDSIFTGNTGTRAYTISDVVKALKTCGIIQS